MNNNGNITQDKKTKSTIFLVIGVVILMIFGLWLFGDLLSFLMVYPWVTSKLVMIGLNIWLARALGIVLFALLVAFVFPSLFSFKKEKRRIGRLKLAGIVILFMVAMFFAEKDRNFNPDGENIKCYTENPYGVLEYVACNNKVHPVYGTEVKPITKAIAAQIFRETNELPKTKRIIPTLNTRLFAPDGTPLVYFYQYPDGKIELFNQPGSHPSLAVKLNPLTPEIAMALNTYLRSGKYNMVITNQNPSADNQTVSTPNGSPLAELAKFMDDLRR